MAEIRPTTRTRLEELAARWRRRRQEIERLEPGSYAGEVYRHCANDLELALRDDATIQPRGHRG